MLSERPHQWEHEQNWQNADKYLFWFHDAFLRDLLKRRYDIHPTLSDIARKTVPEKPRPLLGCIHIEMSRYQITGNNGHAAVIMRPAISNVEFSQFFELAIVLVRLDYIASHVVNANDNIM